MDEHDERQVWLREIVSLRLKVEPQFAEICLIARDYKPAWSVIHCHSSPEFRKVLNRIDGPKAILDLLDTLKFIVPSDFELLTKILGRVRATCRELQLSSDLDLTELQKR